MTEREKTAVDRRRALVIASGGLDSAVMLRKAEREFDEVEALTFDYGSLHNAREHAALEKTCRDLGVRLTTIHLPLSQHLKSALFESADHVPEGHYEDSSMRSVVVPFRNGIMLAVATGYAESHGFSHVLLGNHAGDHAVYPDCRPEFIDAMAEAIQAGTYAKVELTSPFCHMDKADIVKLGAVLGADFKSTWSCYRGGEKHCGKCGTCVERREAFKLAGITDPTEYEERDDEVQRV